MRVSVIVAAVVPFACAGQIVERSAASITNAITNIQTNLVTLNNTVNTLKKGSPSTIATVLKIQSQNDVLNQAVNNATTAAQQSAKLTSSGSNTVANAVLTLEPQIQSLVDNLVAHKPIFDSAFLGAGSVSPQVKKDLQQQQNSSLAFGNALVPKLASNFAGVAPIIISQINDTFTNGIAAFNNSGSGIPVPPIFN